MSTEAEKKKRREYMREWNARNREKVNARCLEYYYKNRKKVIKRNLEYKRSNKDKVKVWAADYREKHADQIAAYNAATKDMQKIRSQRMYENRKDEILAAQRAAYAKDKEKFLTRNAAYRKANRDAVRIQQRIYTNERLKTDKAFYFIHVARRRMANALEGIGAKSARTLELLGCTGAQAVAHIERQFKPGMSWANRREWHIDHIRPLASFDLTDPAQQRQAFHYTNLQPLWAGENRQKAAKHG